MLAETDAHLWRPSRRFASRASLAGWLVRHGFPRLAVALAVAICIGVGFASTVGLRRLGVPAMWIRFPLALIAAYLTFLALLKFLLWNAARRLEREQHAVRRDAFRRQGRRNDSEPSGLADAVGDFFGDVEFHHQHVDPRGLPILLILLLSVTVVLICLHTIWIAPSLLAELIVEGGLATWLCRPAFRRPEEGWLPVALERTGAAVVMMTFCVLTIGLVLQLYFPGAETIPEVWQRLLMHRAP